VKLPACPQRTTTSFSFSMVNRTLLECIADRKFGRAEMAEVLAFFGMDEPECVYCGASPMQRWDHVVPVLKGGDTVLGNIVPACAKCDDSKRHLDYDEWARSSAPSSPRSRGVPDLEARLARIRGYAAAYNYSPRLPTERLTSQQMEHYQRIQQSLEQLKCDINQFLEGYHEESRRNGGGRGQAT